MTSGRLLLDLPLLTAAVQEHLTAVGQVARAHGRPELAARLDVERARITSDDPAMVVCAGEPCVGKSRLLNALVDRPGLLPVDADVSTGVHVVLRAGSPEAARVWLAGDDDPTPIGLDELDGYVSVAGNPGNIRDVRLVEVDLDVPLLRDGLHLVDTPGVGGLDAAHGRITLAALRAADALLFVLDPDGPMSAPELRFLQAAAERIDSVLLVLTKIDNHPDWREVLAEDRQLLAAAAPALAQVPVAPVSARLATAGNPGGDPAAAARRRERAGLPALEQWVRDEVGERRTRVRLRNAARHGVSAAEQLAAVVAPPPGDDAAPPERERLGQLVREGAAWRAGLAEELAAAERAVVHDLDLGLAQVRARLEQVLVTRWRAGAQDLVAAELQAELKALELELEATLGGLVARASTRCVTGVGLREVELPAVDVDVADPVPVPRRETPGGDPGVGTRLGRRLVEAGGDPATWANMPVALLRVALVLVGSVFEVQSLRRSREQEEARQRVAESLAAWNRAAALALAEAVRSARAGAERRIGAALEERLAALTESGPAAAPARPEEQAALAAARDGLAEALVALGSAGVAG